MKLVAPQVITRVLLIMTNDQTYLTELSSDDHSKEAIQFNGWSMIIRKGVSIVSTLGCLASDLINMSQLRKQIVRITLKQSDAMALYHIFVKYYVNPNGLYSCLFPVTLI